jgi:hypothetical protein
MRVPTRGLAEALRGMHWDYGGSKGGAGLLTARSTKARQGVSTSPPCTSIFSDQHSFAKASTQGPAVLSPRPDKTSLGDKNY